ncbi:MAG TPA: alpha/beta fold hydrolase [Vicinamibacterales bacterium]|jgi:alpha/beta superfamily hydrolase|nr:alpha/beta fold hydrolase [Vicinamibacterales bacterium]
MPAIHDLAGPAGHIEALIDEPSERSPRAAVVFAHPLPTHGGTMHTKAVYQGTKGLVRTGCAVLRFNFRGVGKSAGHFDGGPGEMGDFTAAIDYVARKYPGLPIWAAGFSFGAWIALETGAMDDRVSVLIGIAPPVTKEGYDFTAARASTKPKFFVQGEADDVCPIQDMWKFYGELPEPKELVVIDAADHLFDGHTVEVGEALEDLLGDFEDPKSAANG